ncbi:DUF6531 domain-containing protein [Streptomyces coffeae]|uniref:Type IV secretion protein Rhs n=1 Tax=Streptomyces coffeae TaxID=621382 RepID=A0ABS1NCG7_9ACTN|nr:DUF6531 domain-containing protein [Streptomyces coffeae]MBL1097772.1 type IV secretion protein Rhs [Streptomyces coffeae]
MTQKDATEGGTTERIPANAKPSDVIPGSPTSIEDLAVKLRAYAGAFQDGVDQLDVLSLMNWTGAASEGFQGATEKLPKELGSARTYFTSAASALDSYAAKLRSVQKRVKPIIDDADEARAASKRHWQRWKDYSEADDRKDDPLPEKPPEDDPGMAALDACYKRLDKLEKELKLVVDTAKRTLDTAKEKAPDKPAAPEGVDYLKQKWGDFFGGAKDTAHGWYKEFEYLVEDGPQGAGLRLAGMADGVAYAVDHPKEFAKAVVNWDEWQRNPARAAGQLTPDLLLALATGGTGAIRRGGNVAKNAAQRLLNRERALGRDGSARKRTDSDPDNNNTPNGERPKKGEPIDVATGEMVMSATDVTLPGLLPLVLERHYVSGHPCGGWLGRTWAGTLDQRLEIDDAGVIYITDDGMLLAYPIPEPDIPTLPVSGPRWPLCWDGKPDSTFTITAPEHNRTLHFAPLPAGGRELVLTAITDRTGEGDRISIAYDAQGAPAEISHSGGYRIAIDTDPQALRITALRLLHGAGHQRSTTLISYDYSEAGDLSKVINSTGMPLRFQYDDAHRITSWTDRNGTSYAYVYDHRGRVLRGIGPDGILSGRMHYDNETRTNRYTDSQGNTTTYVCNEAYRVIAETDPLGNTTHTEWDANNRHPIAVTNPLGHTTRYRYDDQDRLIAIERPDGSVTEAAYDDQDLPLEIREPNGALWRHTYDDRGARTSTTDPNGSTTRYTYNASGHLSTITNSLGHTTQVTTNAAGLPMAITDALGNTTRARRGPHGRVIAITDPLGNTTRQGWTIEGQPAWREGPGGAREVWRWDTEGNLARHTDRAGHTTAYTHTHFDQPATRTDPDGAHYTFAYDTELRLTEVTNPQGRQWHYTYDAAGRPTAETDFNGARRTYERDTAGRLTARTNALGETLRYTLDTAGRVVAQHDESTGEVANYTYDANGALSQASNVGTELTVERDPLGRIIAETVNGRTSTYVYDSVGNQTHRTTPSGLTSAWTYDATGRPSTLATAGHTLTFTHDAAGRAIQRVTGDVALTQDWDEAGRLATQTLTASSEEHLLQHRAYTYRPDGYVTQIRELTTGTRRFTLDTMGRVTGVQAHGWTEKYTYDPVGNQNHAAAPDHPAAGERTCDGTLIRHAGRTRYQHDAAGRLIRKTRKLLNGQTRTWTYTWDAEDRLTRATTPDGQEWTYTYDPLGRRTAKSSQGKVALTFTWDTSRLTEQTTHDGLTTSWDYSPDTHRPLTQADQELGSTRFHAIVTDPIGTPTELITPDGDLTWQHRTTLWGTPLPGPPGTATCPLRFPGQYADPETGLNYNHHRYYDPETAHYLTPDPLGLAPAPSPHAYVHNPQTWRDPLGLEGCSEDSYSIEDHVIPRHTRGGAEADATKSLFEDGADLAELATGSAGQIGHYQAATGNIRYFITAREIVGTDRHGLATKTYTIIRDGIDGELITMHPGLPRDLDP